MKKSSEVYYFTIYFILRVDRVRYYRYNQGLEKKLKGRNAYPRTLVNVYRFLSNYKAKGTQLNTSAEKVSVAFTID